MTASGKNLTEEKLRQNVFSYSYLNILFATAKIAEIWGLNVVFLDIFALNFHSGVCTTTCFCFKRYPPCKIWSKCLFYFFRNIGPNLAQFLPQNHTHFFFFASSQWNMLKALININNNCYWNPWVLKKIG